MEFLPRLQTAASLGPRGPCVFVFGVPDKHCDLEACALCCRLGLSPRQAVQMVFPSLEAEPPSF